MVAGVCSANSVLRLDPEKWYNDELINTIPAVGIHTQTRTWLLPSWIYDNLKKQRFAQLSVWVERLRPRKLARWVFGICEKDHWRAVKIDFDPKTIFGYDPHRRRLTPCMTGRLMVRAVAVVLGYKTNIRQRLLKNGFSRSNLVPGSWNTPKVLIILTISRIVAFMSAGFCSSGF